MLVPWHEGILPWALDGDGIIYSVRIAIVTWPAEVVCSMKHEESHWYKSLCREGLFFFGSAAPLHPLQWKPRDEGSVCCRPRRSIEPIYFATVRKDRTCRLDICVTWGTEENNISGKASDVAMVDCCRSDGRELAPWFIEAHLHTRDVDHWFGSSEKWLQIISGSFWCIVL